MGKIRNRPPHIGQPVKLGTVRNLTRLLILSGVIRHAKLLVDQHSYMHFNTETEEASFVTKD